MLLDVIQVMPNHIHGIIMLADVGAGLAPAPIVVPDEIRAGVNPAPTKTVGDIVGAYKSLVVNDCLALFKQKNPDEMTGQLWQRNYHEHIIRNEQLYQRISKYIINKPKKWRDDKFYK